jgi:hypothetical protein
MIESMQYELLIGLWAEVDIVLSGHSYLGW